MTEITVADLQPGTTFTLNSRKNAKRHHLGPEARHKSIVGGPEWTGGSVPPDLQGKVLLVMENCRQLILDLTTIVYIP